MMRSALFGLLVWTCMTISAFGQQSMDGFTIGQRYSMDSKAMGEERFFTVYLPPSYYLSPQQQYPVMYLIDGDYNFPYCTGLIEQLSNVSSLIPEMIIVGIADKGQDNYINNLTLPPSDKEKDAQKGKALAFMDFIGQELKPLITQKYRTAGFDILYGHSIGGLFTVTTLLYHPELFEAYVAVSPSMWWNEYGLSQETPKLLKAIKKEPKFLYLTLGNETQMGVQEFVGILDKERPEFLDWTFTHMEAETHGSVGVASLNLAMRRLFDGWELTEAAFLALPDAKAVSVHFQQLSKKLGYSIPFPPNMLGRIVNYYYRENRLEEWEVLKSEVKQHFPQSEENLYNAMAKAYFRDKKYAKSIDLYQANLQKFPQSLEIHHGLAKNYEATKDYKNALIHYQTAVDLAKSQSARQWMKNYLLADLEKLKSVMKK